MSAVLDDHTLGPQTAAGAAAPVGRWRSQTRMELRLLLRNGENLLVTLGIPLGVLVFFGLVPVLPSAGGSAVDFLVPGVVALSIMGSSLVSLGISTGFDRAYLVLKRLGATPLRRRELVAAKAAAVLAVQAVQVTAVLSVGAALGWAPQAGPVEVVLAVVAVVLASVAFAGVGLALAGGLPAFATLAATNAAFLLLMLVSGIVVPLERLPEPLQAVARIFPSTWLTDVLRQAVEGQPVSLVALVVLGVWAAGAVAVAAAVFRWE